MFRNLSLRSKIFAIALPPLLVLAIVSAYAVLLSSQGGGTVAELSGDVRTLGMASLAALLLSALTMIVIGRSIVDPVDQLKDSALEVANQRLPALVELLSNPGATTPEFEPLPVNQSDELGELVGALNAIQEKVVEVAQSQQSVIHEGVSDLVINLARRNQTLLDRQLELIDRLEHDEEDPERLEELFGLDHLATRMRRNAESLLVLAGYEPTRRRSNPVLICDTMRVAMSEIEDYTHVDIVDVDLAKIPSPTAMDLAHLASELLENATQFSPPDKPVEVRGSIQGDGGFVIAIIDRGIGMSPEKMAESNRILTQPPELSLGMGRSLGFVVVGHLARRIGVTVSLDPTPGGGTTATVVLPPGDIEAVTGTGVAPALFQSPAPAPEVTNPVVPESAQPLAQNPLAVFQQAENQLTNPPAPSPPTPSPVEPTAPPVAPAPQSVPEPVPAATGVPSALMGTMPEKLTEAIPEGAVFEEGVDSLLNPVVPPGAPPAPPGQTPAGLTRRDRSNPSGPVNEGRPVAPSSRTPEEIRNMLSRYRQGLNSANQPDPPQPGGKQ